MKLFYITPLKWEMHPYRFGMIARTPFGSYTIESDGPRPDGKPNDKWTWSFSDTRSFFSSSYEEAEKAAEEHWINRISQALTPA